MKCNANSQGTGTSKLVGLALTTALASAMLTGCASSAPPAAISAHQAEDALAQGKTSKAIKFAEAAVLADPRNGSYRAVLGAAYLEAGRFASAATSFQDAIELGDSSPRNALSLALALTAQGKYAQANGVLSDWEGTIAESDLGLAYSLAGAPERGIHILTNAIRNGDNTAKNRQNLAYSFALAGRWKEARLMASEDIPADKVGDRMAEWAAEVHPELFRMRVASMLSVPATEVDPGQPVQLALANFPTSDQLALDATREPASSANSSLAVAAPVPAPIERVEVPAADEASAPQPAPAVASAAAPQRSLTQPVTQDSTRFISREVVQPLPARSTNARSSVAARSTAAPRASTSTDGSHLVQLGSFTSEQGARRAWGIYVQRYPELAGHDMVITKAVVRGKEYYRVAAAGYNAASSRAMCGRVKGSGEGCIAYAASNPLPGAVDTGRRFAMN